MGIEQEIDQRSFEAGTQSTIHRKAGAGDACGVIPVDEFVLESKDDVILGFRELGFGSPFADHRIRSFIFACGTSLVSDVGDVQQ